MADQPIETARSPFVAARCVDCGTHVVAVPGAVDPLCLQCRRTRCRIDWPWFEPTGDWHPTVGYCAPGQTWRPK
jgi:hypothetical protein